MKIIGADVLFFAMSDFAVADKVIIRPMVKDGLKRMQMCSDFLGFREVAIP